MGNLLEYSGIVTKVRAMQANLLKPEQYEEIAELHNVTEVVSYLKNLPAYHDYLSDMDEALLHRGDIEKILVQSLYGDYTKLYRFSGLEQRRFLKLYIKRYEVELIKYCFRIIINHYQEPFDLNYKKPFFDRYSNISIERLITARTTDELILNLKGTEYYTPLHKIQGKAAVTLFDYDLALDQYYFLSVWSDRKRALRKKELELYTKDCGSNIDLLNIQWIYRAKKYYELSNADIYALLVPIHYRLRADTTKQLVEAASPDEMISVLENTFYGKHYDLRQNLTLEQMYTDCLEHLYTIDLRRNPYSIAAVNTYLFRKEQELNKLTTVMECIRYGLTPSETLNYVGGVTTQ